eukprot:TRINITY_DN67186_c0_g1_i1.p1 TRINITY_DN67186_c0_g1~~TRINITY_DN67186_c0_g1_i1.p1  ORF type:complete len:706 (-),score=96.84 TRINITY_DN67186_c0_g1_i1:396-2513(-)
MPSIVPMDHVDAVAASASTDSQIRATSRRPFVDGFLLLLPPLLCAILLYGPCVTYSEWYIDELFAVLRNEDARGETPLRTVFQNDFWGNPLRGGKGSWTHKSYRPLSVLSFAVQFAFLEHGLFRPQPLRAFNVALHAANSALVVILLRHGLKLSRKWSCLTACLFAAHPVHVENVVYLVGRADALATTGALLAAIAHLHVRCRRPADSPPRMLASISLLILCALLATVAGLCKESGLTLLVLTSGIELSTPQCHPRRSVLFAVASLGLFAILAVCRFQVTQGSQAAFGFVDTPVQYAESRIVRTWSYFWQHGFYAKLLLLPGDLSWDYSFDSLPLLRAGWRDLRALGAVSAYLGLVSISAWSLAGRGHRVVLLGLQQVIVPFVPASNLFFTVGVTIGERLLYPSTVGASMVLAAFGEIAEKRLSDGSTAFAPKDTLSPRTAKNPNGRRLSRLLPSALACLLLAVYVHRCGRRVWQWRSSEALFAADALAWPNSVKTRHQIGTVYHAQSRYDEALDHYNASLQVLDDNALTDHCIAQIFIETGRYPEAVERFEKIMRGHGIGFSQFNLWMLYVDYGFALTALSQFEQAVPALEHGLRVNAAIPHGQNSLGYAYANLHQMQNAQDAFARGLEYDPDNCIIWNNLAVVWMTAGALQQAAQGLERALLLEPEHPTLVHNAVLLKNAFDVGGIEQLPAKPRLELFFSRIA